MVQSHFMVKPNLVLRLGWGFDKISGQVEACPELGTAQTQLVLKLVLVLVLILRLRNSKSLSWS